MAVKSYSLYGWHLRWHGRFVTLAANSAGFKLGIMSVTADAPTRHAKPAKLRARQWLLGTGLVAAVLALLAFIAVRLIPPDETLARRVAAELEAALGVPVSMGALHWQLLPSPRVELQNAVIRQPQPIEINKLTLHLSSTALWQRRLKVNRAVVQGAVVPQMSLRDLAFQPAFALPKIAKNFTVDALPLARIEWVDVTWISRHGRRLVYEGNADFDVGWRPRTATLRRPQVSPPAELTVTRQGLEDRWKVSANLGGGTADGEIQLHISAQGGLRLSGKLQSRDVDVASVFQAFERRAIVAGKLSGDTTLAAQGANLGEIAKSLHTATTFNMGRSALLRFDLDKAIRSVGKNHAGVTPLDAISGQIGTQNTPQGMVVTFSRLRTSSGALSASGTARLANQQIDAELAVDLAGGLVGVPLTISGPVDKVQVSVPASAIAGAAVGTAVLPGVGTVIGARIGSAIGKLFGSQQDTSQRPAPNKK